MLSLSSIKTINKEFAFKEQIKREVNGLYLLLMISGDSIISEQAIDGINEYIGPLKLLLLENGLYMFL